MNRIVSNCRQASTCRRAPGSEPLQRPSDPRHISRPLTRRAWIDTVEGGLVRSALGESPLTRGVDETRLCHSRRRATRTPPPKAPLGGLRRSPIAVLSVASLTTRYIIAPSGLPSRTESDIKLLIPSDMSGSRVTRVGGGSRKDPKALGDQLVIAMPQRSRRSRRA